MAEAHHKDTLGKLEATLELYFHKKAPALPQNVKEIFVKIAPYLAIVSVIVAIPGILVALGLSGIVTVIAPFGGYETMSQVPTMWLSILLLIPAIILEAMAVPGLFTKKMQGWKYMFFAQLVSIVSNLVALNISGALIGGIISFYILFQIKGLYK